MVNDLYYLTDEQRAIRDLARELSRERIAPQAAHVDETEDVPGARAATRPSAGPHGSLRPRGVRRLRAGALAFCLAVEEIAWACAATATIYLVQTRRLPDRARRHRGAEATLPAAARDRRDHGRLLPVGDGRRLRRRRARGDRRAPGRPLRPERREEVDDERRRRRRLLGLRDGRPRGRARHHRAPRREGRPGLPVGKHEDKMGIRCSPTVALHFTRLRVPVENRLGEEGKGFKHAMLTLDRSRPASPRRPWASRQAALDPAVGLRQGAQAVRRADRRASRGSSSCSPTWRCSGGRAAGRAPRRRAIDAGHRHVAASRRWPSASRPTPR